MERIDCSGISCDECPLDRNEKKCKRTDFNELVDKLKKKKMKRLSITEEDLK